MPNSSLRSESALDVIDGAEMVPNSSLHACRQELGVGTRRNRWCRGEESKCRGGESKRNPL
jgi:hypothetical protein